MAYEVTKLVKGRPYRYRVQSERNPDTGKIRNRWTYLGRGDAERGLRAAKPRGNAREALLNALERALERSDPAAVTIAAVSAEAGLAHGTFYRYFRNKVEALYALAERLRSTSAAELGILERLPASAAQARRALRGWTEAVLRLRSAHYGLTRAWYALAARDAEMRAAGRERRDAHARRLVTWLRHLAVHGFAPIGDPESAAAVLIAMLDGIGQEALAAGEPLDEARIAVAVDLFERAVFGVPS